jgi:HlyD family secretion protein
LRSGCRAPGSIERTGHRIEGRRRDRRHRVTNDQANPPPRTAPTKARSWARALPWLVGLVLLCGGVYGYLRWSGSGDGTRYVTTEVKRGPVVRAITTTGAVDPVITVLVGAYVSGTIQSCSCDYNTKVKAGQLCAKIDPRPYQMIVDQSTANLANAEAQLVKDQAALAYAKISYERDAGLLAKGVVSHDSVDSEKSTYDQALAQIKLDEATIQQRKAELHAAQVNLDYTNIISPVDGTVVQRNITIGQTVAASFQTPTLFLIAQDLTKMQVDTNVSETDVGNAKVGQKAFFTVEAYPDRTFWGEVAQVRSAPITVQNVVTYNVVVNVDNDDLALLPGMTANTRIITEERGDVLRVPVRALRYTPKEHVPHAHQGGEHGNKPDDAVWVLRDGEPMRVPLVIGLNDGTFAEVLSGDVKAGDRVIVNQVAHSERDSGGMGAGGPGAPSGPAGPGAGPGGRRMHF